MEDTCPFAHSPDGGTLVCGDGPELLVYDGLDGSPRWKAFCDGILVSVAATSAEVLTLDSEGLLTRWRAADGALLDRFEVAGGQCLDVFSDGIALVQTPHALLFAGSTGVVGQIPYSASSACAFGESTQRVGVGYADGTFRAVDAGSGATLGECKVNGCIVSVAWSTRGHWVLAHGNEISQVSADGKNLTGSIAPQSAPLRYLSVADNGAIAAAVLGHNQVMLFDLVGVRSAGTVNFRRSVGGAAFGTGGQLAIGLDDGDAMRLDIYSGKSHRTEPQPGRGRNTFNLENALDADVLRGANANVKAGGAPIAKYVGAPEDKGYFMTCLTIFGVFMLLSFSCAMCSGLAYYFGVF